MIEIEESYFIAAAFGGSISLLLIIFLSILYIQEKKKVKNLEIHLDKLYKKFDLYQGEMNHLKKYRNIRDADAVADKILKDSELLKARAAKDYSNKIVEAIKEARAKAERIILEAREESKKAQDEYEKIISEAKFIAKNIEDNATNKAQKIAGEAIEAKNNAEHYEATVKAMKNAIKGYGDEYLIPIKSLIDELAEEYDHKQAGQDLKNIRQLVKQMIERGEAADCDYSEPARRSGAISFVLDAFNGKVATILAKVKHNNYGILLQQLKDAYRFVNHNGVAFRNVRIMPAYFDVSLEQLKLAVAVQELKRIDQEEQRAIKQQMREEEKARRDYEKALKETEKEEKILQKLMKEAEAKIADTTAENKLEWEAKLAELHTKLEDAELRGQRALSMAQQTKQGHVYVISNIGSFGEDVFKIGLTRRLEPMDRVKELGDASVPFQFDVHAMIFTENAPLLENELHNFFKDYQVNKVNPRKEFFKIPINDIKNKIDESDLEVHWTLKAEALQYRESLQMAKV